MTSAPDYRTSAEKVRDLQETHNIGMTQAREIVQRQELRDDIRRAETVQDLQAVLLTVFPEITL